MTPSDNSFTISPYNLALLHSTLIHSYPVPLNERGTHISAFHDNVKPVGVAHWVQHSILTQQWQPSNWARKVELLGKLRTIIEDFWRWRTMFGGIFNSKLPISINETWCDTPFRVNFRGWWMQVGSTSTIVSDPPPPPPHETSTQSASPYCIMELHVPVHV